ncbi:hypothetical protein [Paracoccus sp. (in: a-proteobacteria)]|uniref:hypothetical protein n=1 Tax=Paracoccus sp. TaxID=267 RepID=UPI0028B00056|nr:hypothetical protein [Paracoccus sp. (in: a-proteobacteria)]
MSYKKLAPMPTDTALARFVARLVRRWPFAWAETVRDRERTIHNQRTEIWHLLQKAYALEQDLDEMMRRHVPDIPLYLDVTLEQRLITNDIIARVDFQTVNALITFNEARRGYSAAGRKIMHRTARALAREHAAKVEQVILQRLIRINERQRMPW